MKALFVIAALLGSPNAFSTESLKAKTPEATSQAASNELRVGVKGMVCAFCAQGIEKNFKAQKEIESVKVSLEDKFVLLKFKDGQRLPNERIAQVLKDAGYEADFAKADSGK